MVQLRRVSLGLGSTGHPAAARVVLAAALSGLAACGPAPKAAPASKPAVPACGATRSALCGSAAAAYLAAARGPFGESLSSLEGAVIAVYLPTWSPPVPVGECATASAGANLQSYSAEIWLHPCTVAVPAPPASALQSGGNVDAWLLTGTAPGGAAGASPAATPAAAPTSAVGIGGGLRASYTAASAQGGGSVLQWQRGGWTYQVVGSPGTVTGAGALAAAAGRLRRAATAVPPVPGVPAGTVVEWLRGAATPTWVLWEAGGASYVAQGPDPSILAFAASVVPVSFPE